MLSQKALLQEQLQNYYVDFDMAMGKGTGYFRQIEKYQGNNLDSFNFFKTLYQKNHFLKVEPQENPKIPQIIHQIWIGNRQISSKLQEYQKTWREQHPHWEYKLWTNEEVKNYTFVNEELKFLFDQALTIGERVDVLRYDILYQYGGIYADCDCICLKPLDVFVYCYDFFAGMFHPMFATMETAVFLQNCLIGAKPKHPIIKRLASLLVQNWDNVEYKEDEFYTTIKRTFYGLTLASIDEAGKSNNIDIVMPPTYFSPIATYPVFDMMTRGFNDTILGLFNQELAPYSSFKDCSFAHHYSTKEWVKDIYSTISFKHQGWTLFNLEDWWLFLIAKVQKKAGKKQIVRQTFEELISR
ncbi:hypothetical protein IQ270_08375 [Microcoleus sp. LEGE 07076]|uniref:glycosyltransferase family 32 protein n=1 Tax=Microcoleus sp. LEGE 07076 TaxID=915322 RepID=UPI0018824C38|nr:glycosyltransferase [Microcoleus sp. LEGE 07076]MBE9184731.1 hypothetical protein [Microcoleus sp. LEGE 07076]